MALEELTLQRQVGTGTRQQCLLSFNSICKRFKETVANDSISFDVESGGIHAIIGENGAGKSTLSKILYGYYRPDRGSIFLNGKQLTLRSPADARRIGIGMVHQQLALVPSLTGFENVILGDPKLPFAFSKEKLKKQVAEKARQQGFHLDLFVPVSQLSIADRQKLEIFKLLWRNAKVLILDEPTSQLTPFEAEDILSIAQNLAENGRIVILITHHISEVVAFARRITVLRQGKCITTVDGKTTDSDDLARLMVDTDAAVPSKSKLEPTGDALISLSNVSTRASRGNHPLREISLDVRAGEIVGVAGISGSGQTELGRLLAGLLEPSSGEIARSDGLRGKPVGSFVSYIPCDQKQASASGLSVAANCFLKSIDLRSSEKMGFLSGARVERHAREIIESFQIVPSLADVSASALSGGNLQRLIIARELLHETKVIVADNPCAGLDAAMSLRVGHEFRKAAASGRAVVLISPNLEELMQTCDRIIIMFNGHVTGQQEAGQFDYQSLAKCMGGKK